MSLPFIPRGGLPNQWVRFLHWALIRHLRVHLGVTGCPSVTETERDAIDAKNGDLVYNTTASEAQVYENSVWRQI
jgi:hypothetical protein